MYLSRAYIAMLICSYYILSIMNRYLSKKLIIKIYSYTIINLPGLYSAWFDGPEESSSWKFLSKLHPLNRCNLKNRSQLILADY